VPKYYERLGLADRIGLWFKVSRISKLKPNGLTDYRIASSKGPVAKALHGSMAGLFVVEEGISFG
jgi:hypothetical protein